MAKMKPNSPLGRYLRIQQDRDQGQELLMKCLPQLKYHLDRIASQSRATSIGKSDEEANEELIDILMEELELQGSDLAVNLYNCLRFTAQSLYLKKYEAVAGAT